MNNDPTTEAYRAALGRSWRQNDVAKDPDHVLRLVGEVLLHEADIESGSDITGPDQCATLLRAAAMLTYVAAMRSPVNHAIVWQAACEAVQDQERYDAASAAKQMAAVFEGMGKRSRFSP
jgi:hypothetical protein